MAENRNIRDNTIKPKSVEVQESITDPGGVTHTGSIGGGMWEELENNFADGSDTDTISVDVNKEYDLLRCDLAFIADNQIEPGIRVNGHSDNDYYWRGVNGVENSGYSAIRFSNENYDGHDWNRGSVIITGSWDITFNLFGPMTYHDINEDSTAHVGGNNNISPPVNSVEFVTTRGEFIEAEMHVFGRSFIKG